MCFFFFRFWKVSRLWTTVYCLGSTTRHKQSESVNLRARPQGEGTRRGGRLRRLCTPPPWSPSRGAPHAGTHWTMMTRKPPFNNVCPYHDITFGNYNNVLLSVCSMGGIPAVGSKGERLLLFIGIIDILQSYR